uniref:NADH-ubiquinone oxidoreductase chain 1 n=1 Tax=Typosyllis antoni TaxID=1898412 RepID=A0A1C9UZF3_9ANNE|nr:NADH dehydrogenase subunit 1 [Typosyllis antoni]AOR87155.1 NADH dehydrogenase subunit 1 [Typosyllis antoni]
MMTYYISMITTFVITLAAMAFFTLLERKILGYAQIRKGPNKVSIMGIPQPMADALKLFTKTSSTPTSANFLPFAISPMSSLLLALILWTLAPTPNPSMFINYGIVLFLCISSLSVYTTISMGWASNSKYALLGALRSIAQTISYEVTLALWLIATLFMLNSFNLQWMSTNSTFMFTIIYPIILYIWFTCLLAETNRTPFDFAEGESELVSGFNIEYSSSFFAFIFMSEYMNIMFVSIMTSILFMQKLLSPLMSFSLLILQSMIIMIMFIILRATLPRMRYDRLMNLTWMSFLPASLAFILNTSWISMLWY